MILFLIRHGQTELHTKEILVGWHNDPGLDDTGVQETRRLAQFLREITQHLEIEAIYSSPLPRALQTSVILGEYLLVPISVVSMLKDINMGDWEGQMFFEVEKTPVGISYFQDPVGVRLPKGEEITETQARVLPFIEKALATHKSALIIVSHLEIIKLIVAYLSDRSLHKLHELGDVPFSSGWLALLSNGTVELERIDSRSDLKLLPMKAKSV